MAKKETQQIDLVRKATVDTSLLFRPAKKDVKPPSLQKLVSFMETAHNRTKDNAAMKEILTDLNMVEKIYTSSIISPKDLSRTELYVRMDMDQDGATKGKLEELIPKLQGLVDDTLKLPKKLPTIVSEMLFDKGAHPFVIIPQSFIRTAVQRLESKNTLRPGAVTESYRKNDFSEVIEASIVVSDHLSIDNNLDAVLLGEEAKNRLSSAFSSGLYAGTVLERYNNKKKENTVAVKSGVSTTDKESEPLVIKWPMESLIPIHVPGDVEDHIGYYGVVNGAGQPISYSSDTASGIKALKKRLAGLGNNSYISGLAATSGIRLDETLKNADISPLIDQFEASIDKEIMSLSKSNKLPPNIKVGNAHEVYRLMFSRVLAEEKIRMVYIPAELVTYAAFDHDEAGMGKSLLESTKTIGSMRIMLMVANLLGTMEDAVPGTDLNIDIDPEAPDWQASLDIVLQEWMGVFHSKNPIGSMNIADITENIQRAAVNVNVNGGELVPGTKVTSERRQSSGSRPDSSLSDELKLQHYNGLGIPPEFVERAGDNDLATLVNNRTAMFSRDVSIKQMILEQHLTDLLRKYVRTSGKWIEEVSGCIKSTGSNNDFDKLNDIIDSIHVDLPHADTANIKAYLETYNSLSDFVDKAIEAFITEDMEEMLGRERFGGNGLDGFRSKMGGYIKRQWLKRQGIGSDLFGIFDAELKEYDGLAQDDTELGKIANKIIKSQDKLAKIFNPETEEPATDSTGGGTDSGFNYGDSDGW